jgi:hypothetical protein
MSGGPSRRSYARTWIVSFILALPALYLLSIPPFRILVGRYNIDPSSTWTVQLMKPFWWVESNTVLKTPMIAYKRLWMDATGVYYEELPYEDGTFPSN